MKKYLSCICIALIVLTGTSCKMKVVKGEGEKTSMSPEVAAFNAIDNPLPIKTIITVQAGSKPGITFSGYENIIKHIRIKTDNNKLQLYTDLDETWTISGDDITIAITVPSLSALSLEGSGNADIHGNLSGSNFALDISGTGKVIIDNVSVDSFSSDISGAGNLEIKGGTAKYAAYDISGAGNINAFALQATQASATISGVGKGQVTALQTLTANINGAGSIKYKGHPTLSQQVSGVGTITPAN